MIVCCVIPVMRRARPLQLLLRVATQVLTDGVTHTLFCEQLISWQRSDTTLSPLFEAVCGLWG